MGVAPYRWQAARYQLSPGGPSGSVSWVFLVKKGYQETDSAPRVSVITKLKGISVTEVKDAGNRLWDVADYVKPPQVRALRLPSCMPKARRPRATLPARRLPKCVAEGPV
uniref:Uncharacterized protein n=1 Tax=Apteryx owenii TaxID=8824 RepID=A0A8B9NTK3_APTOW